MRYRRDKLRKAKRTAIPGFNLIQELENADDGERYAMLTLRLLHQTGCLRASLKCQPIVRFASEFDVKVGRIDALLFHLDGGLTIIEAKGVNALGAMAGGIGQLLVYDVALRAMVADAQPPYINRILAVPLDEGHPALSLLAKACHAADCLLFALPSREAMRGKEQKLYDRDMALYHGA